MQWTRYSPANRCLVCLESGGKLRRKCPHCSMVVHAPCFARFTRQDKTSRCPACRRLLNFRPKLTRASLRALSDAEFVQMIETRFEGGLYKAEDVLGLVLRREPTTLSRISKVRFYEFLGRNYDLYIFLRLNIGHVLDWMIL